jgi:aldose sugar dehydrogenase
LAQIDAKTLLCVILSLLAVTMMFSLTYSFSTGRPGYYNETGKNNNQQYVQREIVGKDLVGGTSKSNAIDKIIPASIEDQKAPNLVSNSNFSIVNNKPTLPLYWNDSLNRCDRNFTCKINGTDGWDDKLSFQLSTTNNTNNTWSFIKGREIDVKAGQKYQLVSHMKLNNWATQSHVAFEVFNETSKRWYQITQCPGGLDAQRQNWEWREFRCFITIPENTTKIRPILNAGWSSQQNKEGTTWFDSVSLIKDAPFVSDPNLKVEALYQGLEHPTSMAFLGKDDILVLEKDNGTVRRIVNGTILSKPLLDVPVESKAERGMLGVAIQKNMSTSRAGIQKESTYVFLYFTAAKKDGGKAIGNSLYRYELVDNKLVNPKLLLDLPAGFYHNGGRILIGPDHYLYLVVGELDNNTLSHERNKALNNQSRSANEPDGRGGILRIDQNGQPIGTHGILGDREPINKYYAYGIRNSFGMDFDPLTGKLWDTENGPLFGDEINLVEPGFNSGWRKVQGIWNVYFGEKKDDEIKGGLASENPANLINFDGKGRYSSPEFTWNGTLAPTAIKFLSTDKLGKKYENDIFVADVNNHRIYHFELNQNRTALLLQGPLIDKVADSDKELNNVIFAGGFGLITDFEIGPDGYLYFLVFDEGKIYRIVPAHPSLDTLH